MQYRVSSGLVTLLGCWLLLSISANALPARAPRGGELSLSKRGNCASCMSDGGGDHRRPAGPGSRRSRLERLNSGANDVTYTHFDEYTAMRPHKFTSPISNNDMGGWRDSGSRLPGPARDVHKHVEMIDGKRRVFYSIHDYAQPPAAGSPGPRPGPAPQNQNPNPSTRPGTSGTSTSHAHGGHAAAAASSSGHGGGAHGSPSSSTYASAHSSPEQSPERDPRKGKAPDKGKPGRH